MPALQNINLTIEDGSFVGVIGQNGSGKTTLAYSLNGLVLGQYQGIKEGMVKIGSTEVEGYRPGELPQITLLAQRAAHLRFDPRTLNVDDLLQQYLTLHEWIG